MRQVCEWASNASALFSRANTFPNQAKFPLALRRRPSGFSSKNCWHFSNKRWMKKVGKRWEKSIEIYPGINYTRGCSLYTNMHVIEYMYDKSVVHVQNVKKCMLFTYQVFSLKQPP